MGRFAATLDGMGELAEILDASVRAAAQENIVDPLAEHRLAATEIHVGECFGEAHAVAAAQTLVGVNRSG